MLIKSRFDGVLKSFNKMLNQLDDIVNQTNSEISLAEAAIKEANVKKRLLWRISLERSA